MIQESAEIENIIKNIIKDNISKNYSRIIRAKNNPFRTRIMEFLNKRYPGISIMEQLYLFYNNIDHPPYCSKSGRKLLFNSFNKGYRKNCGDNRTCECNRESFKERITNKSREWKKNRYQKIKETIRNKYNVENISMLEETKNKIRKTNLERFGVENPTLSKEIRNKQRNTLFKNYGVDNPSRSEEIKEKIKTRNMMNFGVEYPLQSERIRKKFKETMKMRYGEESFGRLHIPEENRHKLDDLDFLKREHHQNRKSLSLIAKELGVTPSVIYRRFAENNMKIFSNVISTEQKEIAEYIQKIYKGEIEENRRGIIERMELDIYLPEISLAIEYCGLYWHSFNTLSYRMKEEDARNFHLRKLEKCLERGIRLITVFSDEWIFNRGMIENIILFYIENKKWKIYEKMIGNEILFVDRRFDEGDSLVEFGYRLVDRIPPRKYGILKYYMKKTEGILEDFDHDNGEIIDLIYDCGLNVYRR